MAVVSVGGPGAFKVERRNRVRAEQLANVCDALKSVDRSGAC